MTVLSITITVSIFPKIMRCEGKLSQHLTTISWRGHPGIEKTKELVLREYWWPKMKKDIENYVRACETCQRTMSSTQAKSSAPSSKRHPLPDLGHTSLLTWSLVYLGATVKMLS